MNIEKSLRQDPLNLRQKRNIRNTPNEAYNCGGFALSVFDWVTPYMCTDDGDHPELDDAYTDNNREQIMNDLIEEGCDADIIEDIILEKDCNYLLSTYPFLQLTTLEECTKKDRVIAYRVFIQIDDELNWVEDTDFHFKMRINGFWFEKMGSCEIRLCNLDDKISWAYQNYEYDSRIIYFKDTRYGT